MPLSASPVIRIQHHPARYALLPPILEALAPLPVEVVTDPDPSGSRNAWRTYRACLEHHVPERASHVVVLQDDTVPCPGFPQALAGALTEAGEVPVALFVSVRARRTGEWFAAALREGRSWCDWNPADGWLNVVAIAWPASLIPTFLAWCDSRKYTGEFWRADDAIVGEFMRATRTRVRACVPCLVEHPDTEVSVTQPRRHNHLMRQSQLRTAISFASEGAEHVDWSLA